MKWKGGKYVLPQKIGHDEIIRTNKNRGKRHFDRSLGLGWIELGGEGGGGWWSWTSMGAFLYG